MGGAAPLALGLPGLPVIVRTAGRRLCLSCADFGLRPGFARRSVLWRGNRRVAAAATTDAGRRSLRFRLLASVLQAASLHFSRRRAQQASAIALRGIGGRSHRYLTAAPSIAAARPVPATPPTPSTTKHCAARRWRRAAPPPRPPRTAPRAASARKRSAARRRRSAAARRKES